MRWGSRDDPISAAIKMTYDRLKLALSRAQERAEELGVTDRLDSAEELLATAEPPRPSRPLDRDAELVRRAFEYLVARADRLLEVRPENVGPLRLFSEAIMSADFYRNAISALVRRAPRGSVVVEVYAGPGIGSQVALQKAGVGGVAADLDPVSLEIVEERAVRLGLDLRRVLADHRKAASFAGAPVDMFLAVSPSCWLVDPVSIVHAAYSALAPGGALIAFLPTRDRFVNPVEPFLRLMGVPWAPEWSTLMNNVIRGAGFRRVRYKRFGPFTAFRAEK